jgi:hypothetical protein
MAVGFAALIIFKKAVRSLPVVGGIAKPLLGAWGDAHTVLWHLGWEGGWVFGSGVGGWI